MRGRRERDELAAQQARDAAAQAFYRMDTAQRGARIAVAAYQRVDRGPASAALAARLAPLDTAAETVAARYIATVDRYDLDHPEVDVERAAVAFREATAELDRAAAALDDLVTRSAPELERADRLLVEATERVRQANAAVEQARAAVGALAPPPREVAALLAEAEAAAARLAGGAAELGLAAARATSDEVRRLAERTVQAATTVGERTQVLARRLASLRVRVEAVGNRAAAVEPELSLLRRKYVEASWRDVAHALEAARPRLAALPGRIGELQRLVDEGELARAEDGLHGFVTELETVEAAVDGVGERRRALEAIEADPAAVLQRARFAVRDAQRLVVAGPAQPATRAWAARLDGLVARLEHLDPHREPGGLGAHRDWWALETEALGVERAAHEVVDEIRRARRTS